MLDELQREISALAALVAQMGDTTGACGLACERLRSVIGGPVAILEKVGPRWRLRSSAPRSDAIDGEGELASSAEALAASIPRRDHLRGAVRWAWVPLGPGENRVMLLPAGWHEAQAAVPLERSLRELAYALEAVSVREQARRAPAIVLDAYGFARRLSAIRGTRVHQFVTDEITRVTRANQGALALFFEDEGALRIVSTSGYPRALVEHVRVQPGEGVIGRVFASRRALLVSDIAAHGQLHARRPRYRTPSFIAAPLLRARDAIGVVCLADRDDDKPFDAENLRAVRIMAGVSALAIAKEDAQEHARHASESAAVDPATHVFNRRYFVQRVEEEVARAQRYAIPLSLLLIAPHEFTPVHSPVHPASQAVVRALAEVLRQHVRVFDVCGHYSEQMFGVLLPASDAADALSVAERIRRTIEGMRVPMPSHEFSIELTVSVGAMTLRAGDAIEDFVSGATRALQAAQQRGRNQICAGPVVRNGGGDPPLVPVS